MITLESLTKRFGPKVLFEDVSMIFDPGKRYVLVGANGAGKSTLLKVISGEEESDTGTVSIPSRLKVGVLRQDHFHYDACRILDVVLMGNKALWDAMQEKEKLFAGR
jgi:ATPase subunit of ABC transporter with duplicated ATPase domains